MIGAILRAVIVAIVATISLAALLQLAPTQRPFVLAVYLLIMGGLVTHLLVTWLRLTYPPPPASPFDTALAARPAPARPPAELDAGPLISMARASALHAHNRSATSCGRSPPTGCVACRTGPRTQRPRGALGEPGGDDTRTTRPCRPGGAGLPQAHGRADHNLERIGTQIGRARPCPARQLRQLDGGFLDGSRGPCRQAGRLELV